MYAEDDLLPISALQHLSFCERQCALIHIEGAWAENRLTAEGRVLHSRTDEPETESRGDVLIARALRLRSFALGLSGVADVVEFHRAASDSQGGVELPNLRGLWRILPVEYKRGRPKSTNCDAVQLCAQALCLEEMLGAHIPEGALFYGEPRRRTDVLIDDALRAETRELAERLHTMIATGTTPAARYDSRCKQCSLIELCLPKSLTKYQSSRLYIERMIASDMVQS
jgi:CRISPR-associated exonuclease Cas4